MGVFDSVIVDCPHCGQAVEFQSKDGNCDMSVYSVQNAPLGILLDIKDEPQECRHCKNWVALFDPNHPPHEIPRPNLVPVKVKTPPDSWGHGGWKWWPENRRFTLDDISQ